MKKKTTKELPSTDISRVISANIKKYRLMNHLTQEKMAELLYIDTQYYAQLERGLRNFTIDKIVAICYIFHIGIDKIIEIETSSPDKKETEQLQKKIHRKLDSLSYTQLVLTDRFISEVLPCVNQ